MNRHVVISGLLGALLWAPCNNLAGQTSSSEQADEPNPGSAAVHRDQRTGTDQDENSDLARLPKSVPRKADTESKASGRAANQRIYIENVFTFSSQDDQVIVPVPQSIAVSWQNLLFLDVRKQWKLADRLNFTLSDRLHLRAEDNLAFLNHASVINSLREGFLSWEPFQRTYFDLGLINLRSGAALGFNPTDFFKTRTVQEPLTADPAAIREDRLGALMLEMQHVGQGWSLTAALAPALLSPHPMYTSTGLPSFTPSINRTNDKTRWLIKGSVRLGSDFAPEVIFYREGNQTKGGVNLTRVLGQRVVVYGEWAGGERASLIDEVLSFGRQTGSLPPSAPRLITGDSTVRFQNDVAAGGTLTPRAKLSFNLEYHFHQAGFSKQDWSQWFSLGNGQASYSPIAQELWYMRGYASDQQEPLTRHAVFLRADWSDAMVRNLELSGFVNCNTYDRSALLQVSADYYLSDSWSIGAQLRASVGTVRSEFGSLPQRMNVLLKVAKYF